MDYDVIVIGAGPGGYNAAALTAKNGKKTAVIEAQQAGGTCLNRGCIPTKALLCCAEAYASIEGMAKMGVHASSVSYRYEEMASYKDSVVSRLRSGTQHFIKQSGATLITGQAAFLDAHTVMVDGKQITAENIIIATGSEPFIPPIKGANHPRVISSTQALALKEAPKSIVIIGGGVIGYEFATLYASLGVKVTILEMLPSLLNGFDSDVTAYALAMMQQQGVNVHTLAKVEEILPDGDGIKCVFTTDAGQTEVLAEMCLVATGRKPVLSGLGLENAGVKLAREGYIEVNEKMQTNIMGIYAIGDVAGKIQLAHVASAQAHIAASNILGDTQLYLDPPIPACVYGAPEIASVGLTQQQAEMQGIPIVTGKAAASGNGRMLSMNETEGFAKFIADARTGAVLGCHIVAPSATEMIAGIAGAMKLECTIHEISHTVFPHPTVSELLLDAAQNAEYLLKKGL
ncbi:dihydrolipoyl dehydrogenase [Clostridia bacterium OttesenSCG-928-F22]|nr:dihydrolipoyl dehydrogenase [Clostridia bacterium OttesenSCG-928-F22]